MPEASSPSPSTLTRRSFLAHTGVAAASLALLPACGSDPPEQPEPVLDLGSGDSGVIGYLYFLERFSASFYTKVLAAPPTDLTPNELAVLRDIYRHELAHRETFAQVFAVSANGLTLNPSIPVIEFKYDTFTLTTRAGVLAAAQTIEDMGVAALCGVAKLLTNAVVLQLVMKMLAVEARHAATIRELVLAGNFAGPDVVAQTGSDAGLNKVLTPVEVAAGFTDKYSPTRVVATNLPTT